MKTRKQEPRETVSIGTQDPKGRLLAAALVRAAKDLFDQNPLTSVDSLLWWLSDGPIWLEAITGIELETDGVLFRILGEKQNGRKIVRRFIA